MNHAHSGTPARGETRARLLVAARACLLQEGFARFSTRRVADLAGVPLSQISYHFGSKGRLVLALLEADNRRLLQRQVATFAEPMPLSARWERACDHLEEDLASGYVRVLHEMIAAGWSDPEVARAVRANLQGWHELLTGLAEEAAQRLGGLGPFTAAEVAALVGTAFLGSEALILLGHEGTTVPARKALRRVAEVIRAMEGAAPDGSSGQTCHAGTSRR